jgi:hypothetical protein
MLEVSQYQTSNYTTVIETKTVVLAQKQAWRTTELKTKNKLTQLQPLLFLTYNGEKTPSSTNSAGKTGYLHVGG